MKHRTVRGRIDLPGDSVPPRAAALVVQVEDVSRADAPSIVVGEKRDENVELEPGGCLFFSVAVPVDAIEERHLYTVRVHVDVTGSGDIHKGDLITMQSYPVLTRGNGDEVTVAVRPV